MIFGLEAETHETKTLEKTLRTVVFDLGRQVFAVRVDTVREILRWQGVRPIPHTHKALLGVATIRGEVIPVIDIGAFLKIDDPLPIEQKKLIVLELQEGIKTALAVDEVKRIYDMAVDRMDRSLKGVILSEYLDCVIKHDEGDILMPDPEKIMEALRLETIRLSRFAAEEISPVDPEREETCYRGPSDEVPGTLLEEDAPATSVGEDLDAPLEEDMPCVSPEETADNILEEAVTAAEQPKGSTSGDNQVKKERGKQKKGRK